MRSRTAVSHGDLLGGAVGAMSSPEILTFSLWSMTFGAHVLMAADKPHDALGIEGAREALDSNYHALLDGLGRRPLTRAWDYQKTFERIRKGDLLINTANSARRPVFLHQIFYTKIDVSSIFDKK